MVDFQIYAKNITYEMTIHEKIHTLVCGTSFSFFFIFLISFLQSRASPEISIG